MFFTIDGDMLTNMSTIAMSPVAYYTNKLGRKQNETSISNISDNGLDAVMRLGFCQRL